MDCSEAKSHLSAFASGLTNDLDRTEIEEHLASCEACSLEVELLRGRAAGQISAPKPSDWTLEKIFGNEGGAEGGGGERDSKAPGSDEHNARALETTPADAAPPPIPAPTQERPAERPSLILPPPASPEPRAEAAHAKPASAKPKTGSWDFEPADAGKDAAPPEESLAFAEEALGRKMSGATNSKATAMRALIWSLGGVAGLGLLGVSVWIAMAVHTAPTREISTGAARSAPSTSAADPGEATMPDPSPTPPSESPIQARTLPAIPAAPPTSAAAAAPDGPPIASGTTTTEPGETTTAPRPVTTAPSATSSATPTHKALAANPKPTPSRDASAPKKAVLSSAPPVKPVKRDDDDMWPTDDAVRAGSGGGGSIAPKPPAAATSPVRALSNTPTTATTPAAPATKPDASADAAPPATHASPSTSAPQPSGAVVPPTPQSPIDRLHVATDKAAADRDLASLRQLRTAWKGLLRTTVGRDRSRTKRELADCLWAIQGITGRDADRLESLNAYRDYLLNAPAGGTDTRSAERLRELEDALHESN